MSSSLSRNTFSPSLSLFSSFSPPLSTISLATSPLPLALPHARVRNRRRGRFLLSLLSFLLSRALPSPLSSHLLATKIASVARRDGRRKVFLPPSLLFSLAMIIFLSRRDARRKVFHSFSLSFFPPFLCLHFSLFVSLDRSLSIRQSISLYRPNRSLSLSLSLATLFFRLPPSLSHATEFLFRCAFSFLFPPPFSLLSRLLSLLPLPFFIYHLEDSSSCGVFFAIKRERKEGR